MKILYFASLKESIKTSGEEINAVQNMSAGDLRLILVEKYGHKNLPNNILCSVNYEIANASTPLNNADEVAFYPPVTGG